jgi:hypothetical protein
LKDEKDEQDASEKTASLSASTRLRCWYLARPARCIFHN